MKKQPYKIILPGWTPRVLITLYRPESIDALCLMLGVLRCCYLWWLASEAWPAKKRPAYKLKAQKQLAAVKVRLRHLEDGTTWRRPSYAGTVIIAASELVTLLELSAKTGDASSFMDGIYLRRNEPAPPEADK